MANQFDLSRYFLGNSYFAPKAINKLYTPNVFDVITRRNAPEYTGMPGDIVYIDQKSGKDYIPKIGPEFAYFRPNLQNNPLAANLYKDIKDIGFRPSPEIFGETVPRVTIPPYLKSTSSNVEDRTTSVTQTAPEVVDKYAEDVPRENVAQSTGLLDLFGGPSALDQYFTPQQKSQLQNQAVMSAAMQLLASSGPTRAPISLGQSLGEAYGAGQKGYTEAQQNLVQSIMAKQKMDELQASKDMQSKVSAYMSQEKPEGVDPKEWKAQQYMKLADLYAARNPEQASKFFDMAQKLMPVRPKVSGQPFEVTDASGKRILVQQNEYGDTTTMQGFGPIRKVVLQNVDGVMTAIDESALKGGEKFGTGISPADQARINNELKRIEYEGIRLGHDQARIDMDKKRFEEIEKQRLAIEREQLGQGQQRIDIDKKRFEEIEKAKLAIELEQLNIARQRLGISQQEFQRGLYDRVQNEDGVFYVSKVPGFPVIPIIGPGGVPIKGSAGGKPTESEQNAAGFAQRMERVESIINSLPQDAAPGMASAVGGAIPFVGGAVQRGIQSADTQRYQQAANDWIRAKLRKESGAAIGKDEMESEYKTYFPQVGDTAAVIAQKNEARRIATEAMKINAGKSYKPFEPYIAPSAAPTGAPVLTWDPVAKKWK